MPRFMILLLPLPLPFPFQGLEGHQIPSLMSRKDVLFYPPKALPPQPKENKPITIAMRCRMRCYPTKLNADSNHLSHLRFLPAPSRCQTLADGLRDPNHLLRTVPYIKVQSTDGFGVIKPHHIPTKHEWRLKKINLSQGFRFLHLLVLLFTDLIVPSTLDQKVSRIKVASLRFPWRCAESGHSFLIRIVVGRLYQPKPSRTIMNSRIMIPGVQSSVVG